MLHAEEALAWGLVSRVVPDADRLAAAQALARDVATATAPVAVGLTKRLLWRSAGLADPAAAEALEARVFAWAKVSPEAHEGLRAFAEKRPAVWPAIARDAVIDLDAVADEDD
jgi:enoyl-CoA hydratase/carnithine racemase